MARKARVVDELTILTSIDVAGGQTPSSAYKTGHVEILLAVCNGAAHLDSQLASLEGQSHKDWSLLVSDDGSTDQSMEIIRAFADRDLNRTVRLVDGPMRGFPRNFCHLLQHSYETAEFYAFCDQDDVWMSEKIARSVAALGRADPTCPAMYCGRTYHSDEELRVLRTSPDLGRAPSFRNALWQNIGGGNTIVVNRAARDLLTYASQFASGVVSHDWWIYQMITGVGGQVIYERIPQLFYRQHRRNSVGAREGFISGLRRLGQLSRGRFGRWTDGNLAALLECRELLTDENRDIVERYADLRRGTHLHRASSLRQLGLYRQSRGETALMRAACIAGLV